MKMTHYFVRVEKEGIAKQGVKVKEPKREVVHEYIIEAKSMLAVKRQVWKSLDDLPVIQEVKEFYGSIKGQNWDNEYKRSFCEINYWDTDYDKYTVIVSIRHLQDYYTFGKSKCRSAMYRLNEVVEEFKKEPKWEAATKPTNIDTHPEHLKPRVKEIEAEFVALQAKLEKLNDEYSDYYDSLG